MAESKDRPELTELIKHANSARKYIESLPEWKQKWLKRHFEIFDKNMKAAYENE